MKNKKRNYFIGFIYSLKIFLDTSKIFIISHKRKLEGEVHRKLEILVTWETIYIANTMVVVYVTTNWKRKWFLIKPCVVHVDPQQHTLLLGTEWKWIQ